MTWPTSWRAWLFFFSELILGERVFEDVTSQFPLQVSSLQAVTLDDVQFVIYCEQRQYHTRYPRFGITQRFYSYHVYSRVSTTAALAFQRAADFTMDIPATYPPYLDREHNERVAIEHYLDRLRSRMA